MKVQIKMHHKETSRFKYTSPRISGLGSISFERQMYKAIKTDDGMLEDELHCSYLPLGDLDSIHSLATTTFIDIYLFAKKRASQ